MNQASFKLVEYGINTKLYRELYLNKETLRYGIYTNVALLPYFKGCNGMAVMLSDLGKRSGKETLRLRYHVPASQTSFSTMSCLHICY